MNKEFIPYEQALELKDLGFNEKCLTSYNPKKELVGVFDTALQNDYVEVEDCFVFNSKIHTTFVAVPLYQQAFRWFREKYGLFGCVCPSSYFNGNCYEYVYHYSIIDTETSIENAIIGNIRQTPEQAELACLNKLIEIVKNK